MSSSQRTISPVLRTVFRAPVALFRWNLGWILRHRFLLLVHDGRRTGLHRRTVLEVLRFDRSRDEAFVISGLGARSDWFRNICRDPKVTVEIAGRRYEAVARPLAGAEPVAVLEDYERRNRWMGPIIRFLVSRLVGWRDHGTPSDRARLVRQLPLVSLLRTDNPGI